MAALSDRLRTVRVCCGDWIRICDSPSTTTRLGITGVFLDPPYSVDSGRGMGVYRSDCGKVAHEVRDWCREYGTDPMMRVALCGLEGEHNELEGLGWFKLAWKAQGGYGNRNEDNKNDERERIWFSPHCETPVKPQSAFDFMDSEIEDAPASGVTAEASSVETPVCES